MIKNIAFIVLVCILAPNIGRAACSRANLTRCLDSACALNLSSNPSARCQYCGTSDAGAPNDKGMRTVSVGASSKYNISANDLKSAPSDPGARYVWATQKCIDLVNGCTTDDVSNIYDPLIEQSCKAAGISAQMSALIAKSRRGKTSSACESEITACIVGNTKCAPGYINCGSDSDFDKYFSECTIATQGCEDYLADIRTGLTTSRDNAIKNVESQIQSIVQSYRDAREKRLASIIKSCKENTARDSCISSICNRSMPNKCDVAYPSEKSMATQLCKFYDTACSTLKY